MVGSEDSWGPCSDDLVELNLYPDAHMEGSDPDQRKFSVQNFRVTDIQQLFNHHSSYTTHQISWQVQHFVNLQVQISWPVQYKMRFREIADARNAVFFNRTGGFEPGKSSSAERRLRDGLGSRSLKPR